MGKAGQNNFTGISAQADIALLYLLESCNKPAFQHIIIEGHKWEDFTLVFDDHYEDFEVKWHKSPTSYSLIRSIVKKAMKKNYREKDILKIALKNVNPNFLKDFDYIKSSLWWWHLINKKLIKKNQVIKNFTKRGWSAEEIAFLLRTEIIIFNDENNIDNRISEYFALSDPFYLNKQDQESLVALNFKSILSAGTKGGQISKQVFLKALDEFKKNIAKKSEFFSPEIAISGKIIKINDYLSSENEFAKLNDDKYLSSISYNMRFVFYITDMLQKGDFHVDSFKFFIESFLLKNAYLRIIMRLLKNKWKKNKVSPDYLIQIISKYYKNLFYDFNYDDALGLIKEIAENDANGVYEKDVFELLKTQLLLPFSLSHGRKYNKQRRGWREEELVADIIEIYYDKAVDKSVFIDFIFGYFDFTEDHYSNVIETHPKIYNIVKNHILSDVGNNYDSVLKLICNQFDSRYGGKYKGYEWVGGGRSQAGSTYSLNDIGVVRLLFKPLFDEFYGKRKDEAWQFIKNRILQKVVSKESPVFLRRALIDIIIGRAEDFNMTQTDKKEAFTYLSNIIGIKEGLPSNSEVIFDRLRTRDLSLIGYDKAMLLVKIDAEMFKKKGSTFGYPSSLFAIHTIINLIKSKYVPAKTFFLSLIKSRYFAKYDKWYDSFELLAANGIPQSDPDFIVNVWETIDLEKYLRNYDSFEIGDKSGVLTGLVKSDWQCNKNRGELIIRKLLRKRFPSKVILEFISRPISDLSETDPIKTYKLFKPYLKAKRIFKEKFKNHSYARQNIVKLAESLAKVKAYKLAQKILEYCMDDSNPETHNRQEDFNYHLEVKQGKEQPTLTTVRGMVAWALNKFAASNNPALMEYALKKAIVLLDMKGSLARKLGYSEPDYYVRSLALMPILNLAPPKRRKMLNEYKAGLGDKIKSISFDVMSDVQQNINSNNKPIQIINILVQIFSFARDLNTDEAKRLLLFFEQNKIGKAHFLFVYYALYDNVKLGVLNE